MKLKTKLIVYIVPLVLFVSLSFLAFYIYRSNDFIKKELTDFGFHLARDLSYASELAVASEDPVLLQPSFVGTFREKDVVLVTVYNKKGYIISFKEKVEIEEEIPRDVMEELIREKKALKRSGYTQKGEEIYNFYSPILISETLAPTPTAEVGKLIGFVRVGLSLEKVRTQSSEILTLGLSITALVIILGIFILFFLAENLTKPIGLLTKGAETVTKGNLDYRLRIKTGDEIEQLAQEFNRMTGSLKESRNELEEAKASLEIKVKARTEELEELTKSLDEQVKERTKELHQRVEELERFQKLTIGRELKMVELKKEIERLEKELKIKDQKK
ncbi:HAMP domain-containing protein [Patescibacteria group bacterium]|nr:HAMP domain-containing protein [Patescibacteria group bacterium]